MKLDDMVKRCDTCNQSFMHGAYRAHLRECTQLYADVRALFHMVRANSDPSDPWGTVRRYKGLRPAKEVAPALPPLYKVRERTER